MTFQDIFKSSFLETTYGITLLDLVLTLSLSFIIGVIIFYIYKYSYQNVVYTKSFSISLIMMTMITSLVILTITSNIILSLGMVGALSIVRFRSAIKDPVDIVFMFWAITIGIVNGAGFYAIAIIGSVIIGLIIYILNKRMVFSTPYLLLLKCNNDKTESNILDYLQRSKIQYRLKSKTVTKDYIELIIELRIKKEEFEFVNEINKFFGMIDTMLIQSSEYAQ